MFQAGDRKMLARLAVHRVRAPGKCMLDSAAMGSMRLYRCVLNNLNKLKANKGIKYHLLRILDYFPFIKRETHIHSILKEESSIFNTLPPVWGRGRPEAGLRPQGRACQRAGRCGHG